jgi:shikimate 5-dehydrogenase
MKNKVAVIYGAGGPIGGAVARAFAREGAVFLAGRTQAKLDRVAGDIARMALLPMPHLSMPWMNGPLASMSMAWSSKPVKSISRSTSSRTETSNSCCVRYQWIISSNRS